MTKLRRRQTGNVSWKGIGFKTRERTPPESEAVAGSSTMTTSTPLQLQYACVVELRQLFFPRTCPLCLANVFSFSFFHSISSSPPPWDYHERTQTQETARIRPLLRLTTISRFGPPTTPPSVLSSANLDYRLHPLLQPPRLNAGVHITVDLFSCHTFPHPSSPPPITVCQPIVVEPCLCEPRVPAATATS